MKSKSVYMHTIMREPAFFDGDQICYLRSGCKVSEVFANSLKQIRKEQLFTKNYREKENFDHNPYEYSHMRFWNK